MEKFIWKQGCRCPFPSLPCYNSAMDIEYVDILKEENFSSIKIAAMVIIYLLVRSSNRIERDGENEWVSMCVSLL